MLHPNPSGGGMMDSHIYKKAANRLPAMAGIQIIRFNTRGTVSEAGKSDGEYDLGKGEKLDVLAALDYCFEQLKIKDLYVIGWLPFYKYVSPSFPHLMGWGEALKVSQLFHPTG